MNLNIFTKTSYLVFYVTILYCPLVHGSEKTKKKLGPKSYLQRAKMALKHGNKHKAADALNQINIDDHEDLFGPFSFVACQVFKEHGDYAMARNYYTLATKNDYHDHQALFALQVELTELEKNARYAKIYKKPRPQKTLSRTRQPLYTPK